MWPQSKNSEAIQRTLNKVLQILNFKGPQELVETCTKNLKLINENPSQ